MRSERRALPTINNTVTGAITQAGITNAKVLNLSSAPNGRRHLHAVGHGMVNGEPVMSLS